MRAFLCQCITLMLCIHHAPPSSPNTSRYMCTNVYLLGSHQTYPHVLNAMPFLLRSQQSSATGQSMSGCSMPGWLHCCLPGACRFCRRVVLIGVGRASGSGKSVLSQSLSTSLHSPLISISLDHAMCRRTAHRLILGHVEVLAPELVCRPTRS